MAVRYKTYADKCLAYQKKYCVSYDSKSGTFGIINLKTDTFLEVGWKRKSDCLDFLTMSWMLGRRPSWGENISDDFA